MVDELITVLKSKIHRVTVTSVNREYEGSCLMSASLLNLARIREYEQIHVYNVTNGERFTTYAISSKKYTFICDPLILEINGAAVHKASVGDVVIICAYKLIGPGAPHTPIKVFVDERNTIKTVENLAY